LIFHHTWKNASINNISHKKLRWLMGESDKSISDDIEVVEIGEGDYDAITGATKSSKSFTML